jgi:hypothetical protein
MPELHAELCCALFLSYRFRSLKRKCRMTFSDSGSSRALRIKTAKVGMRSVTSSAGRTFLATSTKKRDGAYRTVRLFAKTVTQYAEAKSLAGVAECPQLVGGTGGRVARKED